MGLDVDVLGAEESRRTLNCEALDLVDHLPGAAVIAPPRISLCVLVGQEGAKRLEDGRACEVLRRDQLECLGLAAVFVADEVRDVRVLAIEGAERHRHEPDDALLARPPLPSARTTWISKSLGRPSGPTSAAMLES